MPAPRRHAAKLNARMCSVWDVAAAGAGAGPAGKGERGVLVEPLAAAAAAAASSTARFFDGCVSPASFVHTPRCVSQSGYAFGALPRGFGTAPPAMAAAFS